MHASCIHVLKQNPRWVFSARVLFEVNNLSPEKVSRVKAQRRDEHV